MKNHYRYFQRGEKTPWIVVTDDQAEMQARAQQGVRLTILATNKRIAQLEEGDPPKDMKYYGPFYADIDSADDLKLAIESAQALVKRLHEDYLIGERDIQIYLSGGKGLHIIVPPEAFGLDRSVPRLPQVYAEMARELYVSGMDMQVYSARNAFRLVNVKREKDGKFRIQITMEELAGLDEKIYRKLVSEPRQGWKEPTASGQVYTAFAALFTGCQEIAKKNEKPIDDASLLHAPQLKQNFDTEMPPCMDLMCKGKVQEQKSFNLVVQQAAIFMARLDPSGIGRFKPVIAQMADNIKIASASCPTTRLKREHIEGQYAYYRTASKYSFSCNAMRSVIRGRPCDDCPIEAAKLVENPADAAEMMGIKVRSDGYFDQSQKAPRRISTFILEPEHVYMQAQENGEIRRVGTVASVSMNGQRMGTVMLDEQSWANRQAFLKSLSGIGNLGFLGSENDLQKLKFVTMSDADLPEKTMVKEMGMHVNRIRDKEIRTYVEKGISINSLRQHNTFTFDGSNDGAPFLLSQSHNMAKEGDAEAAEAIELMLDMNDPVTIATAVGWAVACHLKPHLMHLYRQFPLVNMWGGIGSGKTTTARYICAIAGVDYITEHEEMNVPGSTPYAMLDSLSNNSSVPVLWDELNKGARRMDERKYAAACEMLKGCFNGQAIKKGELQQGTKSGIGIRNYKLVRPAIFCSEEQPENSALIDRSLNLLMFKGNLNAQKLLQLRARLPAIHRVAVTLMLQALLTPTDEVAKLFIETYERVPDALDERPRHSYCVALLGLVWLRQVLVQQNIATPQTIARLLQAEGQLLEGTQQHLDDVDVRRKRSQVDKAMGDIFELMDKAIVAEKMNKTSHLLIPGVHFQVKVIPGRRVLNMDVRSVHSAYLQYARGKGVQVVLDDLQTFIRLARQEDYVEGLFHGNREVLDGRATLQLDLDKAQSRGLPIEFLGHLLEEF